MLSLQYINTQHIIGNKRWIIDRTSVCSSLDKCPRGAEWRAYANE